MIKIILILLFLFSNTASAQMEISEYPALVLSELRSDIEVRPGDICIIYEQAIPFSKPVLIDCGTLLSNILVGDSSLNINTSERALGILLDYSKAILDDFNSHKLSTFSSEEELAVFFSRLQIFLNKNFYITDAFKRKIDSFYEVRQTSILSLIKNVEDEESCKLFKNIFDERWPKKEMENSDVGREVAKELSPQLRGVTSLSNDMEVREEVSFSLFIVLGLFLLFGLLVFYFSKYKPLNEEVDNLLSREERAELRELKVYFGVSVNASLRDLSRSYREKVKEVHPDSSDGEKSLFLILQNKYSRAKDLQEKYLKLRP